MGLVGALVPMWPTSWVRRKLDLGGQGLPHNSAVGGGGCIRDFIRDL